MKVQIIKTGEIADYNDSYAHRLIEQGKAKLPPKGQAVKADAKNARKADAGK